MMFGQAQPKGTIPVNTTKKKNVIEILDPKRSKNIEILLQSRFKKLNFSQITTAILQNDSTILTHADISSLCQTLPTEEEVMALRLSFPSFISSDSRTASLHRRKRGPRNC